jgi:hypothetical protein
MFAPRLRGARVNCGNLLVGVVACRVGVPGGRAGWACRVGVPGGRAGWVCRVGVGARAQLPFYGFECIVALKVCQN